MLQKINSYRLVCALALTLFIAGLLVPVHAQTGPGSILRVDTIVITGNKITRPQIILRELVLSGGVTYSGSALDSLMARSRENLLNTLLFNFVEITRSPSDGQPGSVQVAIHVTERWYVWPIPILLISDRNFNVWWETKDFSRLSYGFYIDWRNFRGRKENLRLRAQFGYDRLFDFQYTVPYFNRRKTLGLTFGGGMWSRRETQARTENNRHVFYEDPSSDARNDLFFFGQLTVRKGIHNTHLFEVRYDHHHFSDSLLQQNEHYSVDGRNDIRYLTARYLLKSDHRDFKNYPLKGWYFDLELNKQGFWDLDHSVNTFNVLSTFRKYWALDPRLYFASGLNVKLSAGAEQPYFLLRGIGYDRDMVRSYEYYVVDATHFGILKNNLKFALIPQTIGEFRNIRSERFRKYFYALYMNLFVDAGYGYYRQDFGRETNDLQNALLLGYGAGLDFVAYYDVVIRVEFAVNFMNETGIFLHFRAPI